MMKMIPTDLPEVMIFEPKLFEDQRGYFFETFQSERYAKYIPENFVQDNFSYSHKNVLRGLHYQLENPQGKLVWVPRGAVFDVAVDIRRGSSTFGRWVGVILSDENHWQLYIPPGFAHGFCVLSEGANFIYKVTDYYDPKSERGICWNDTHIKIQWPLENPTLSEKDAAYSMLENIGSDHLPLYLPSL